MPKEDINKTIPVQATNRQRLVDRFAKSNPDFKGDDDEAVYGAAADALKKGDESDAQRKRFSEAMSNVDLAPEMMNGILSGKNPDGTDFDLEDYLFTKHLDFFQDYLENKDGAKEKYEARKKERKAQADEDAKFLAGRDAAVKKEDAELDAALKESNYKADQVKDLIDWIYGENGIVRRASRFGLTKADFLQLFKIKDYDLQVSAAEDKGYKRGKNEKIDMFQHKQEHRKNLPPDVNGGGGRPTTSQPNQDPQLAALDRMAKAY